MNQELRIKNLRKFKNSFERRKFLEDNIGISLKNIGSFSLDESVAGSRNCENMIGAVQIPVGVAGPLTVNGEFANGDYYLPLATTEGALVASINRGCKVISQSGGANAYAYRIGATRGPVFYVGSIEGNKKLYTWVKNNEQIIKDIAESSSKHLIYKKVEVTGPANYIFMRFYFDTQDAMGMNMVTIATQQIVELIEKETGFKCLSLAGNFDIDKKPAWLNFVGKRGIKAWAEVTISEKVIKEVLKTTAENLFEVWLGKTMIGSALSGSLGFNGHFANIVASIFIATGQDPGHIGEGSMGITTLKVDKGDLYFSVYLPDLMIGTIGGGTILATQKEALTLLGVYGGNNGRNAMKFAEIIASAVLAGELSLTASLAEGSLVKAHQKLGRGKIV